MYPLSYVKTSNFVDYKMMLVFIVFSIIMGYTIHISSTNLFMDINSYNLYCYIFVIALLWHSKSNPDTLKQKKHIKYYVDE